LTRYCVSALARNEVSPATWKSLVTPRSARRSARRSKMSHVTRSTSRSAMLSSRDLLADRDPHRVPPLDEQTGDVRADQSGGAGHERDGHPGSLGSRACPMSPIVTDTTHYARGRSSPRGHPRGEPLRQRRRSPRARGRHARLRRLLRALRTAPELPTTSQPSIGDFLEVYEPLAADGQTSSRSTSPAASPNGRVGTPGGRAARGALPGPASGGQSTRRPPVEASGSSRWPPRARRRPAATSTDVAGRARRRRRR